MGGGIRTISEFMCAFIMCFLFWGHPRLPCTRERRGKICAGDIQRRWEWAFWLVAEEPNLDKWSWRKERSFGRSRHRQHLLVGHRQWSLTYMLEKRQKPKHKASWSGKAQWLFKSWNGPLPANSRSGSKILRHMGQNVLTLCSCTTSEMPCCANHTGSEMILQIAVSYTDII